MEKNLAEIKIGILTHFYGSDNYGGVLQAYALCKTFSNMGYKAEQIQLPVQCVPFDESEKNTVAHCSPVRRVWSKWCDFFWGVNTTCTARKNAVCSFSNTMVPHSNRIFTNATIGESAELYDVFVVGSDQVWNTNYFVPAFFCAFLPKHIPRFSYAASIAKEKLSDYEKQFFRDSLADFLAVSVREKKAVSLLSECGVGAVNLVCDPVFLLDTECWNGLAAKRLCKERYVFCYFLGNNTTARKLATREARRRKLIIVTLPYLTKKYSKEERLFGDRKMKAVDPTQFLSLIRFSDLVITDSFHAVSFSILFEKQFIAVQRNDGSAEDSRLENILEIVGEKDKFIPNRNFGAEELNLGRYKVEYWRDVIAAQKRHSMEYIKNCMNHITGDKNKYVHKFYNEKKQ